MDIIPEISHNLVKHYHIKNLLGEGGSSKTYEAIDLKTNQRVALKALSLQKMNDWKVLELFEREANVLSKLNHPGIPRYLDYFYVDTPDNRCFYIVQELAEGQSLASLVESGWHASESEIQRIATQILNILVYLHSQKPPVIHRDIKPENIVFKSPINSKQKDWAVCLVDFGAVQNTYYNTLMRGSTVVGTYGYMAPEQFLGQAVPATDLYGLGGTLLYLLTHRSPAELPTNILEGEFRSQIQISSAFADWLKKMIASDLENRFNSAREALELLRHPRIVSVKSERSTQWEKRLKIGIAAIATVAILNHFKYPILNRIGFTPDAVVNAVEQGDTKTVRHYLELGISANTRVNNQNLLHLAGSKEVAELLIFQGADVKAKDIYGLTPLHFAAAYGRIEVAQILIAKGADINAQRENHFDTWTPVWSFSLVSYLPGNSISMAATPLFFARSPEMTKLLIAKGANVNAKNKHGLTPLHITKSKDIAKILLAAGTKINIKEENARNGKGTTLLHNAARIGFKELVQQLINNGANVVIRDYDKRTPLHYAATKEVAALLMLNINARDESGNTPLHLAVQDNRLEVVSFLIANGAKLNIENKNGYTPLQLAFEYNRLQLAFEYNHLHPNFTRNRVKIVYLLINNGAKVNVKNIEGNTPLHLAIQYGNLHTEPDFLHNRQEVVSFLIANGAKVNVKNNKGQTPLHCSLGSLNNMQNITQLLLEDGAEIDVQDNYRKTPLDIAVDSRDRDTVALLISKHPDVNSEDKYGRTLLHIAVIFKLKDVAKQLIAKGAFVHARNNWGQTPLHLAVEGGDKDIAELLIAKGARVDVRKANGQTPLYQAIAIGHKDIAALLINNGADINYIDQCGTTPLHKAAHYGTVEILTLLIVKGANIHAKNCYGDTPLKIAETNSNPGREAAAQILRYHGATD